MTAGSTLDLVHSLQDPSPPLPGVATRAAVHLRATRLRRRRRAARTLAAVSCVALLGVGALVVVDADPATREQVETAAAPSPLTSTGSTGQDTLPPAGPTSATAASLDAPAAPSATEVAGDTARPEVDGTAATAVEQVDAVPVRLNAQVAVQVSEATVPADVELDTTLTGDTGTFQAHVRTPGTLTFADVPPGDYQLRWEWSSDDGSAASAGRRPVHVEPGGVSLTL